jgi:hypothetical protein
MRLSLSHRSPFNSVYINELGQVLFKVNTPTKFFSLAETSTISRIVPNTDPNDTHDRFVYLAEIEHNVLSSEIIRFNGMEVKAKNYLRKAGEGDLGRYGIS